MQSRLSFEHSYAEGLPGTYLRARPDAPRKPVLLAFNDDLATALGLEASAIRPAAARWFSGADLPPGADPIAQAYAGHQFGGFSPQLGDGRAHLLGEVVDPEGRRFDIQLKGSGRTAFSRGGDGKAAVGPMLREYLISEAMHALGLPTTRALAVVATGETILRETGALPGAVLARVAASHLRVGTFQFFAARQDVERLRALTAYTLARHYPDQAEADGPALALFDAVAEAQARLVAGWMGAGFIHGVMNTDNMALSGETIDYGPCAFMETYAPGTVFSSIDHGGRYAYANQPLILGWNLSRFAETLVPLVDPDPARAVEILNDRIGGLAARYRSAWIDVMRRKLALTGGDAEADGDLADQLLKAMEGQGADWTQTFRALASAAAGDHRAFANQFIDPSNALCWMSRWKDRLAPGAAQALDAANPAVIPRNHLVEAALAAATEGDLVPFEALLAEVRRPFAPVTGRETFADPAPDGFGRYVTYCGT
jgi:serine/tyrosine/threonine adenylyltransferase